MIRRCRLFQQQAGGYKALSADSGLPFQGALQRMLHEKAMARNFTSPFWATSKAIHRKAFGREVSILPGEQCTLVSFRYSKFGETEAMYFNAEQTTYPKGLELVLTRHRNASTSNFFSPPLQDILNVHASAKGFQSKTWISEVALQTADFGPTVALRSPEGDKGIVLHFAASDKMPAHDISFYNAEETTDPHSLCRRSHQFAL